MPSETTHHTNFDFVYYHIQFPYQLILTSPPKWIITPAGGRLMSLMPIFARAGSGILWRYPLMQPSWLSSEKAARGSHYPCTAAVCSGGRFSQGRRACWYSPSEEPLCWALTQRKREGNGTISSEGFALLRQICLHMQRVQCSSWLQVIKRNISRCARMGGTIRRGRTTILLQTTRTDLHQTEGDVTDNHVHTVVPVPCIETVRHSLLISFVAVIAYLASFRVLSAMLVRLLWYGQ